MNQPQPVGQNNLESRSNKTAKAVLYILIFLLQTPIDYAIVFFSFCSGTGYGCLSKDYTSQSLPYGLILLIVIIIVALLITIFKIKKIFKPHAASNFSNLT